MIKWRRKETNRNGEGSGMTHDEQRIWLIQRLLDEKPEYRDFRIPTGQQQQKDLLRALMNVRLPDPISEEILTVQDEYLDEESIAFCCISTGVFMFPNQRAAEIATATVRQYYQETGSSIRTVFNVLKDKDLQIYQRLLF